MHHRWLHNQFPPFSLFSTALWDFAISKLVHSQMLSSHLIFLSALSSLPPPPLHCALQDWFLMHPDRDCDDDCGLLYFVFFVHTSVTFPFSSSWGDLCGWQDDAIQLLTNSSLSARKQRWRLCLPRWRFYYFASLASHHTNMIPLACLSRRRFCYLPILVSDYTDIMMHQGIWTAVFTSA